MNRPETFYTEVSIILNDPCALYPICFNIVLVYEKKLVSDAEQYGLE